MFPQLKTFGRLSCVLLFAVSSYLSVSAFGQQTANRPVARLITNGATPRPDRRSEEYRDTKSSNSKREDLESLAQASIIERRAFEMTNGIRLHNALNALSWDAALCRMARLHSERMARENFFSHQTPDGLKLRDRLRASGIVSFRISGENIAYNQGYEDAGKFAVEQWMVSPGHRANILNTDFEASAVGVYVAPDGSVFLTQVFIAR
jgi:uncharacterized protein YkwD